MAVYLNRVHWNVALVCIGILLAGVLLLSGSSSAKIIYVNSGGGGDFTLIQDAITTANQSDIIMVSSGTYNENIIINKTLNIVGSGSADTKLIGSDPTMNTIKISVDNVQLSNFSIDNTIGKNSQYHCIFVDSAQYCNINNNLVINGECGIYLLSSNHNVIHENTVRNNNQKGIRLSFSNNNNINNNVVESNGDGIYLSGSDANDIWQNTIFNNGFGVSVTAGSDNNYVFKNDFDNSGKNAEDTGLNHWSKEEQGNYWHDYNGYDIDGDDIGDIPYIINSEMDIKDMYPLGNFLSSQPIAYIDSINPNPSIQGQTISFYGHGSCDGQIIGWEWSSSKNGIIGTASQISKSSLSTGTHTIRFRVKDNNEQWSEYAIASLVINNPSVEVNQIPTATIVTIDPGSSIEGESIYFHGYGVDSDGMISGYSWRSSRDGTLSSSSSFTLETLSVGSHMIYFKVRDNDGDWSSEVSRQIMISQNTSTVISPVAIIECSSTGIINSSVRFDGSKSYMQGSTNPVLSYNWDFGDGKSGTGQIITHSYQEIGDFTVTLLVEDTISQKISSDTIIISISNVSADPELPDDQPSIDQQTPGFFFALVVVSVSLIILLKKRK